MCDGEGRTPGAKEKGDINFHGKWTPHLALLSAQKATETIISGLNLRPMVLELGEKAMYSAVATASEGQDPVWRTCDAAVKSFELNYAGNLITAGDLVFTDE